MILIRAARNVGVYFVFLLAYLLASMLAGGLSVLGNYLLNGSLPPVAKIGAPMFGAFMGVHMGAYLLNRFRPYPARTYAVVFVVPYLLLLLLAVGRVVQEGIDLVFWTDAAGISMACGTAWYVLWVRRGEVG